MQVCISLNKVAKQGLSLWEVTVFKVHYIPGKGNCVQAVVDSITAQEATVFKFLYDHYEQYIMGYIDGDDDAWLSTNMEVKQREGFMECWIEAWKEATNRFWTK